MEGELHALPRRRKLRDKTGFLFTGGSSHSVYFYDVLLVEERLGIAYRVGLGSIYFEDWDLAGPVGKLVTLG